MLDHFAVDVVGLILGAGAAEEGAQGGSVVDKHLLLGICCLDDLIVGVLAVAVDVGGGELRAAALSHRRGAALMQHARFVVAVAGAADRLVVADHQRREDDDPHDQDQDDH